MRVWLPPLTSVDADKLLAQRQGRRFLARLTSRWIGPGMRGDFGVDVV